LPACLPSFATAVGIQNDHFMSLVYGKDRKRDEHNKQPMISDQGIKAGHRQHLQAHRFAVDSYLCLLEIAQIQKKSSLTSA
jgi:hypothetical protein